MRLAIGITFAEEPGEALLAFMGEAFMGETFTVKPLLGDAFIAEAFMGEAFMGEAFMGAFPVKLPPLPRGAETQREILKRVLHINNMVI